jgi:histidine ammonia-lyase
MIAANYALHFRQSAAGTSPALKKFADEFSAIVPVNTEDHILSEDIRKATGFIRSYVSGR